MFTRWVRSLLLTAGVSGLAAVAACSHVRNTLTLGPAVCAPGTDCPDPAGVSVHPTVHALACDLDHLEKHIECYGSVTAKVPDVWGQARLTQYRNDFEQVMKEDLTKFDAGLQGNYSRSDQSYFAAALSLGLAAQPNAPAIGSLTTGSKSGTAAPPAPVVTEMLTASLARDPGADPAATLALLKPPAKDKPADPIKAPDAGDPQGMVSKVNDVIKRPDKVELTTLKYAGADGGIGIEPAERLAQKKRYLDLLAQLRRENEGSDTADAPGYQLNLIRMPVSVLPGSHTDRGHGAEVTFTVDPVLGDDLLPTTFRRMAANDVVEQFALPLTEGFYDDELLAVLADDSQRVLRLITQLFDLYHTGGGDVAARALVSGLCKPDLDRFNKSRLATDEMKCVVWELRGGVDGPQPGCGGNCPKFGPPIGPPPAEAVKPAGFRQPAPMPGAASPPGSPVGRAATFSLKNSPIGRPSTAAPAAGSPSPGMRTRSTGGGSLVSTLTAIGPSFATGLDNKLPFPTSQLMDVYGELFVFEIAYAARQAIVPDAQYRGFVHLPDIQAFLKQELKSAEQMLAKNPHLLQQFCTTELVKAVCSRDIDRIAQWRAEYRRAVAAVSGSLPGADTQGQRQFGVTSALGWCLVVDAAMLTDRLVRDMRESATAKGLPPLCPPDAWPCVFLPDPPPDARQLFNAYVKMRWPVYVFALDPMAQEQNIADSLSTRRETQLALAVAFTNGAVNAKTFLNAARRLEAEYQTVALNRTQVGFAHGENTFGWRFYPRFQSPPTQSNVTVFLRDQLVGGPGYNALLRQRRLEPGPRECVALVIMPSFVPYVSVEAASNWFRLPDPKCKLLDHTQSVRLSKTVHTLERCSQTVTDAECYRDGELKRLQARVQQLAGRLPAQSLTVPVPVLDTLGGFELFSNGTTDLAPQLFGFYGAPGLASDKETTLFLAGDHFSPLNSKVIVGDKEVAAKLLSRQVMQVTVPAGVMSVVEDKGGKKLKWAHAHLATPYGVSREVYVPVIDPAPAATPAKSGYSVPDKTALTVRYGQEGADPAGQHFVPRFQGVDPHELKLAWADPLGLAPAQVRVRLTFKFGDATLVVPCLGRVEGHTTGGRPGGPPYDPPAGTTPTEADKEKTPQLVLGHAALSDIGGELLRQIAARGPLPYAGNPLADGLTTAGVYVTPVGLAGLQTPAEVKAAGQIKVVFAAEGLCAPGHPGCPPPSPPAVPAAGPALNDVVFSELPTDPPTLVVKATGRVKSLGYTAATLARAVNALPPPDGVQEYTLTAAPPSGPTPEVASEVTAEDAWVDYRRAAPWLRGIRVKGSGGGERVLWVWADVTVKPDDKTAVVKAGQVVEVQVGYGEKDEPPGEFVVTIDGNAVAYSSTTVKGPPGGLSLRCVRFPVAGLGAKVVVVAYKQGNGRSEKTIRIDGAK